MGLSKFDLMTIQRFGSDIHCRVIGPSKKGKFVARIELYSYGEFDHSILITNPVFNSMEKAKLWAERFIEAVRDMTKIEIFVAISTEDLKMLNEIIAAN